MGNVRVPMPPAKRAKIFSMFDALKGFQEALAAQEVIPEERKYLAEDRVEELNAVMFSLKRGTIVTVEYYCSMERCYRQITGPFTKIDPYWSYIQVGEVCIDLGDIYEVLA